MFRLLHLLALASQLPAADAIRDAAAKRGIHFGAAVQSGYIPNEPAFATTLLREFSMVEPEWEMLWSAIYPSQTTYNITGADAIVAYAGHYAGKVHSWEVVNEAVADGGVGLRSSIWNNQPGIGLSGIAWIEQAF